MLHVRGSHTVMLIHWSRRKSDAESGIKKNNNNNQENKTLWFGYCKERNKKKKKKKTMLGIFIDYGMLSMLSVIL